MMLARDHSKSCMMLARDLSMLDYYRLEIIEEMWIIYRITYDMVLTDSSLTS